MSGKAARRGARTWSAASGGCVVLAVAALCPGAVRSLTLIEPAMVPLVIGLNS